MIKGTSDNPLGPDESLLDAGLEAAFGRVIAAEQIRLGIGVLAEIERRIGADTRVQLRSEQGTLPDGGDAWSDPAGGAAAARYQALDEIARGGMGVIIRSRDLDLGREVAMKILQPRHAGNEAMVRRFVEEAQIAGQLQHPGVLQVYELGLQGDRRPYFTMKLIKGRTLADLLADRTSPAEDRHRFVDVFERVCQTMAYTHARGVLHRDLKPANVMVGNFGEVQIVDWGLAKLIARGPDAGESAHETVIRIPGPQEPGEHSMVGSIMGTPAYMAPEQARGEVDKLDERTDVFALGAMLCEILTGHPPFAGDAGEALEDAKAARLDEAFARLAGCDADPELVELARDCLRARRRDRPANAQVVADRVSAYLASVEERARASELAAARATARAAEERRARRLTIALASFIVLVVVAGGGALHLVQNKRMQRIADASEAANQRLNAAMELLAEAKTRPVSEQQPWIALRAAGAQVAAMQGALELDRETADRTSAFLDEFSQTDRDRRMVERIEDLVIAGATHADEESWVEMEEQIRRVFLDNGIDLDNMDRAEITGRIRASELAPQLADGLELWIATLGSLGRLGETPAEAIAEATRWAEVLYQADPDPYRTKVRRQFYVERPDPEALRGLAASPEFDQALPRTLSWLAYCLVRAGDSASADDVFRRALLVHPADFMLNFDYAAFLDDSERWEDAIRVYYRALTLRPKNGGIWRRLGVALRRTGDLEGSIESLHHAVQYQPEYAPIYVDLGLSLGEAGDLDGAIDAQRTALAMRPDLPMAHCGLGLALQARGELFDALKELELGHELGSTSPMWRHPSEQWIIECRRQLARRERMPGRPG